MKQSFWTVLARTAKRYAKAAKKAGYADIERQQLDFAKWCMEMNELG